MNSSVVTSCIGASDNTGAGARSSSAKVSCGVTLYQVNRVSGSKTNKSCLYRHYAQLNAQLI
jgi:hypothetical protein